jgi:hypothetical protein
LIGRDGKWKETLKRMNLSNIVLGSEEQRRKTDIHPYVDDASWFAQDEIVRILEVYLAYEREIIELTRVHFCLA